MDGAGTPEWGLAGDHGCEDTAAGDEAINPIMCLYCHSGPTQECDENGDLLVVQAGAIERKKGGPTRCCDV